LPGSTRPRAARRSTGCPGAGTDAQPRHPYGRDHPDPLEQSPGRAYYDKKLTEGKSGKEPLRALNHQLSDTEQQGKG